MKLRANVRKVTGKATYAVGRISGGQVVDAVPMDSPAYLEIVEDEFGYALFLYESDGSDVGDSWFPSLKEAKGQAQFAFSVREEDWVSVDP